MKYIIKKCPNLSESFYADGFNQKNECNLIDSSTKEGCLCKNNDCILKQIVATCISYRESCKIENNCLDSRLCSICFLGGANELSSSILDDLEIEVTED